jgi:hypothetical protein
VVQKIAAGIAAQEVEKVQMGAAAAAAGFSAASLTL